MAGKMRKILGALLLVTAFMITQIPGSQTSAASSADFQVDNGILVKYVGTASTVSIPSEIKKIGAEAFAGNTNITSVSIGKNVKEIEYGAFRDCTSLTTVALPDSLETIGNGAFSNNISLKRIAFKGNVKNLGSGVFAGCNSLSTLSVDKNNPYFAVDGSALYSSDKSVLYCYFGGSNAEKYEMPSAVTKIMDYAFWGNEKLKEISLSSSLREISGYAFSNCKALGTINIPYSVRSIDTKAFENCIALAEAAIPSSVAYIHSTAFDGCANLTIKADEGTVAYDFYQSWKNSNRGRAVESSTATAVTDDNSVDESTTSDNSTDPNSGKVFVVGGSNQVVEMIKDTTDNASDTGNTSNQSSALNHPSNVDYIPPTDLLDAEEGVLGKTIVVGQQAVILMDSSLTVNSGSTYRNISAEEEMEVIQSFVDEEKGTSLPKYAIIGNSISAHAYYGSTALSAYSIPSNITSIGDFAFARSTITEITLPEGLKEIGYAAFYHCDNLATVNIPSSLTWVEPSAFSHTAWMSNWENNAGSGDFLIVGDGILLAYKGNSGFVEIPQGVKTIAPAVFSGHDEIQGVFLPDSLKVIGEEAFLNCSSLSDLQGGNFLKEIQDRAFQNTALRAVTLADTVESIGVGAFSCKEDGTERVVTFAGYKLPVLSATERSQRASNKELRRPAFEGNWTAVLFNEGVATEGTILEKGSLGFTGKVVVSNGDGQMKTLETIVQPVENESGIQINSALEEWPTEQVSANLPYDGKYTLTIQPGNQGRVQEAFQRIYGNSVPEMFVFDMTMVDYTGSVSLTRFGTRPLEVKVPLPGNISGSNLHVVALDEDGQLELLSSTLVQQVNEGTYVKFSTIHLSTFAIYAMGEDDSRLIEDGNVNYTSVSGKKDYSPNTGDNSIHPKWFIALGTGAIAMILILYRPQKRRYKRYK